VGRSLELSLRAGFPELRPEGPECNSYASKGVVAIVSISIAGTSHHTMPSIIALCRTFGAPSVLTSF
jgi:hypothetical protein